MDAIILYKCSFRFRKFSLVATTVARSGKSNQLFVKRWSQFSRDLSNVPGVLTSQNNEKRCTKTLIRLTGWMAVDKVIIALENLFCQARGDKMSWEKALCVLSVLSLSLSSATTKSTTTSAGLSMAIFLIMLDISDSAAAAVYRWRMRAISAIVWL